MIRKLVSLSLFLCGLAGAFSFSIDQPSMHVTTARGAQNSYKVILANRNDVAVTIKVYVQDWKYQKNGSKLFMPAGTNPNSCALWIKLKETKVQIPANSKKDFYFDLITPGNAVGGNQAVIFFETDIPSSGNMLSYGARLGTIIYQETEAQTKHQLVIKKQEAFVANGKTKYLLNIVNEGNAWDSVGGQAVLLSGEDVLESKEFSRLPIIPGQQVELSGGFEQGGGDEVLFAIEDYSGQLSAFKTKIAGASSKTQKIEANLSSLNAILPPVNEAEPQVYLAKYFAKYDPQTKAFKAVIVVSANAEFRVNASVKVLSAKTDKKVKTVDFNEKFVKPGKPESMSVIWPVWDTLPPGEYRCVLTVSYDNGERTIEDTKSIVIPRKKK